METTSTLLVMVRAWVEADGVRGRVIYQTDDGVEQIRICASKQRLLAALVEVVDSWGGH